MISFIRKGILIIMVFPEYIVVWGESLEVVNLKRYL